MKKTLIYILLIGFTVNCFSQAITVDENTYTIPELVSKVLINSPCVQTSNISYKTGTDFGSTNGIAYFENTNSDFPIPRGIVLSTGDFKSAPGPNNTIQNSGSPSWLGDTDLDNTMAAAGIPMISTNASILEFDFLPISPKFSFDFVFASEEYGNSQCKYSDAFAFLLTNTVTGVTKNLAVVPTTNTPISVFTVRDNAYNPTCPSANSQYFDTYNGGALAANSATNFNGQTVLMNASAVLIPNVTYHIKLVIADRDNFSSDSAIFISSQSFNVSQDVLGTDYTIANKTAFCAGDVIPDIKTKLDPSIYHFTWSKNGVILPGETGPSLSGITAGNYSVTFTNFINNCAPITNDIIIETYPSINAGNPVDIYKCNTGLANYDYDLSVNSPIIMAGSGNPMVPLDPTTKISYHLSLAEANTGSNPLPNLYNSPSGVTIYVRIKNQSNTCFTIKSFKLLTSPIPTPFQPTDMNQCSTNSKSNFILSTKTPEISNGPFSINNIVTYYKTQNDADLGINPINTNGYLASTSVVYARIQNKFDVACYVTLNFQLIVTTVPAIDKLTSVFVCGNYVLPKLSVGNYYTGHLGTGVQLQANDVIRTTTTLYIYDPSNICAGATENIFVITFLNIPLLTPASGSYCSSEGFKLPPLPYGNYYTGPNETGNMIPSGTIINTTQTIYTFYKSTIDPTCKTSGSFTVTIIDDPKLPIYNNIYDCISYTLPPITIGHYYDQPNGVGLIAPGTVINATKTIYVYAETGTVPNCTDSKDFTIFIGTFPYPTDSINCVNYTLPVLPVGGYFTGISGTGTQYFGGDVINTTTSLYVYVPAGNSSSCSDLNIPFTVTVNLPPISNPNDVSKSYCASYTLLPLNNGNYYTGTNGTGTLLNAGYIVKSTKTIYIYISLGACNNEIPFTVTINKLPKIDNRSDLDFCGGESYTLTPMSANSVGNYYTGTGGTGILMHGGDTITTTQTLYIYAISNTTPACPVENYFTVNFTPRVDVINPVIACENYILPVLTNGNYYTQTGGTGTLLHAGDVISTNQTIYIYFQSNNRNGNCFDESNFSVTIINKPVLVNIPSSSITLCDLDGINDGITSFDLTTLSAGLIAGQPSSDYNVTYYSTLNDANTKSNPITLTTQKNIYYIITSTLSSVCSSVIGEFQITVNKIPEPNPKSGYICVNRNGSSYTIQSGISPNNIIFEWYNNNASTLMPSATGSSLNVTIPDTYGVKATNAITNCSSQIIAVSVLPSSPPTVVNFTVTDAFEDNQTVTIAASGNGGDYEYKLDFGSYQDSPIFENISPGEHKITVRDKNGCGSFMDTVMVINYPKYFTPNSDGYNDTWNVYGMQNQLNSTIYIFDRFGKLLKQLKPSGTGWDGTYNDNQMPASDYWFKVIYEENGIAKEFKGHFSLKR